MKWYDTPVSKSRRTSQSANRQNTVPNSRCCRRLSANSSSQRVRLAAHSSKGTNPTQPSVRLVLDKTCALIT
ncbi:hypothetical protein D3C73_1222500 [compost metagenome]